MIEEICLGNEIYKIETIISRLILLESRLNDEGRYVDANIAWLSYSTIEALKNHINKE